MGGQNQVIRRSLLALATCVDLHGLATGQFEVGRQRIRDLGRVIDFSQQTPASEIDVFVLRCVGQLNVFAVGRTLVDVDGTWDERERGEWGDASRLGSLTFGRSLKCCFGLHFSLVDLRLGNDGWNRFDRWRMIFRLTWRWKGWRLRDGSGGRRRS